MNKTELIDYCETLGPVYHDTPFAKMEKDKTPTTAIRHLKNKKIFAYWIERPDKSFGLSVKLDPERAENLRIEFEAVTPAWHMNKTHWSDIKLDADVPDEQIFKLIEESYDLTK